MDGDSRSGAQSRGDRIALVYEKLRELIVWGTLAPGTRVVEVEVARRLGVSRTPVRAALQRLEQQGYVCATSGAQSRMYVAPLTLEDARELFAIVAEVEGLAASWAAAHPEARRRELGARLRAINAQLEQAATAPAPEPPRVFELDRLFHETVVVEGAGPRLRTLHRGFKPQIERYGRIYISALIDELIRSVSEHEELIRAIEAGETQRAAAFMRANWYNASERLEQIIARA